MTAPVRVAVCIATYRRPRMLAELLAALNRLTFPTVREPLVTVVVIDNDAGASAQGAVDQAAVFARWPLVYGVEPRRGISYARNRTVAGAGACDFVVFVDDDEIPQPKWLDELLAVQARENADVVAGPVVPRFEAEPPAWIVHGGYFDRPRHRTGHRLSVAGSGNVLVRAGLLAGEPGPFATRFALSGGEDTHLFMSLHRAGAQIVWADDAVVEERVPSSRLRWTWVLQRAYRGGNGYSMCELDIEPGRGVRWVRAAKGAARIGQGIGLLAVAPVRGVPGLVAASLRMAQGLGMLAGVLGHRYEEYQRVHGA